MIREDAENYFKDLGEQWYLSESAIQLPKTIFKTSESHGCEKKINKKFLACVSLLVASNETGDICLELTLKNLRETVKKAIEMGIERNNKAMPEISKEELTELDELSPADQDQIIRMYGDKQWKKSYFAFRNAFDFWATAFGIDQKKFKNYECDAKIELNYHDDSPFLAVITPEDPIENIKVLAMTKPFFLYRASVDADYLYSSKEFWAESQAVKTLARMMKNSDNSLVRRMDKDVANKYGSKSLLPSLIESIFCLNGNASETSNTLRYIDNLRVKAKDSQKTLSAYCAGMTLDSDEYREHIEYRDGIKFVRFVDDKVLDGNEGDCHAIDWQKHAVAATCLSDFTVITGGPGTGKTTTVASLLLLLAALAYCSKKTLNIALAAPTGKAANRMRESLIDSKNSDIWKNRIERVCDYLKDKTKDTQATIKKKLEDAIPTNSSTIHRLLGSMGGMRFTFGENLRLPHDVIIVDECSMIDSVMLSHLLISVKDGAKIIFLGDSDQLPSVGAGAILTNLCHSMLQPTDAGAAWKNDPLKGASIDAFKALVGEEWCEMYPDSVSVPVAKLFKSQRFSQKSVIGKIALGVNNGITNTIEQNKNSFVKIKDRIKQNSKNAEKTKSADQKKISLTDAVVDFAKKDVQIYMNVIVKKLSESCIDYSLSGNSESAKELFDSLNSMRLLCTHRKGELGVEKVCKAIDDAMKKFLQEKNEYMKLFAKDAQVKDARSANKNAFIPDGKENFWYFGKPVMVTKNNPNIGLYNGDVGIVLPDPDDFAEKNKQTRSCGIYFDVNFKVLFQLGDGSFKYFPISSLGNIEIAFAMTVHKSQGSQFGHAVIVTPDRDSSLLSRELIYTGITRAKDRVSVLYTQNEVLEKAILRKTVRCGNLGDRLINEINKNKG